MKINMRIIFFIKILIFELNIVIKGQKFNNNKNSTILEYLKNELNRKKIFREKKR